MMKTLLASVAAFLVAACVCAAPTVSNVKAQQRYPWNGLVDITCDIENGSDTSPLVVNVAAKVSTTDEALSVTTIYQDGKTVADGMIVAPGSRHFVWDAGTDVPNREIGDVEFTVTAAIPMYMVIDLSSGYSSSKYPVTYMAEPPSGGFNKDEYKTTKLVMRRIDAGSFKMQGSTTTTISKPFYIGLFEVTQKQWSLVMGANPCSSTSYGKGDAYPVHYVSYNDIRGSSNGAKWPASSAVDSSSFLGKLRARTGIDFDLPTEAQWEYACRAGTTTTYYWGDSMNGNYAWYTDNSGSKTHPVGGKTANAWGLYDMSGNVWEWCLDWYGTLSYGTDPKGAASGSYRVRRGGGWNYYASYCTSSSRSNDFSPSDINYRNGFRLASPPGL